MAGLAAIGAGTAIALFAHNAGPATLALIVGGASLLWFGAGAVFLTVDEEPTPGDAGGTATTVAESLTLLRDDPPFRRFVIARTLLLVTALSPPFVVSLSAGVSESDVSGVGLFVIATGIAGLIASPIWGRLADRSSRLVMAVAAGAGALSVLSFLGLRQIGLDSTIWLGPATYLLLAIIHAGARMGRKTYVVDLGSGDQRTRYVAVSNTMIGVMLLAVGLVGAGVAQFGAQWSLLGLALAGLIGSWVSYTLPQIH